MFSCLSSPSRQGRPERRLRGRAPPRTPSTPAPPTKKRTSLITLTTRQREGRRLNLRTSQPLKMRTRRPLGEASTPLLPLHTEDPANSPAIARAAPYDHTAQRRHPSHLLYHHAAGHCHVHLASSISDDRCPPDIKSGWWTAHRCAIPPASGAQGNVDREADYHVIGILPPGSSCCRHSQPQELPPLSQA